MGPVASPGRCLFCLGHLPLKVCAGFFDFCTMSYYPDSSPLLQLCILPWVGQHAQGGRSQLESEIWNWWKGLTVSGTALFFRFSPDLCFSCTHNFHHLYWSCLDGNRAWICKQVERGSRHRFLRLHPCCHGPPHLHLLGKESQVPEKCIDPFPSFTFGSDLMLLYDAAQNSRGRCSHPNSQHGSALFTRGHTLWRPTRCRSRILGQISSTKILLLSLSLICFLLKWFRFHSEWEVVSVPANGWRYQAAWVDHSLCQNALVSGKWEPVCSQSVRLSWGQASHPHVSFSISLSPW